MRFIRYLAVLLFLPLIAGLIWGLIHIVINLAKSSAAEQLPFWLGLVSYFVFQAFFSKPVRTYVFGHELTHAIAGLISGARLKSFKVSKSGGSVVLTKSNLFITLAPYFIPIYTVFVIIVYYAISFYLKADWIYSYYLFLCGFTLSFHFALTHHALGQGQSDLKIFGNTFSFAVIMFLLALLLALLLKVLFPLKVSFMSYIENSLANSLVIYSYIIDKIKALWFLSTQTS